MLLLCLKNEKKANLTYFISYSRGTHTISKGHLFYSLETKYAGVCENNVFFAENTEITRYLKQAKKINMATKHGISLPS